MARYSRSVKGDLVDFDLFEIKKKISEKAPSADVKNRENFVFSKRKRGSKRAIEQMMGKEQKPSTSQPVEGISSEVTPAAEPKKTVKRKIIKKK